jgi:hypothetical protein
MLGSTVQPALLAASDREERVALRLLSPRDADEDMCRRLR